VINHYIMDYIISMFIESVNISVALITSVSGNGICICNAYQHLFYYNISLKNILEETLMELFISHESVEFDI
jgi:hypothetical protein